MKAILPRYANALDRGAPLSVAEYAPDFPDDVLVLYRNTSLRSELYPAGVECLIAIPRARIAAAAAAGKELPFGVEQGATLCSSFAPEVELVP